MSPPRWFQFSAIQLPLNQAVYQTQLLRASHHFKARHVLRIVWAPDLNGFELDVGNEQSVQSDEQALEMASSWDGLIIAYDVLSIRASVYLGFWRQEGLTCLSLETDTQVPYVKPDGMAEGEWLERFMCDYVSTCGAAACANGAEWSELEPLDATRLVARWREQGLPKRPARGFYMLSRDVLSSADMASFLRGRDEQDSRWLRYFQTPTNYHVLSTWSRRDWWRG